MKLRFTYALMLTTIASSAWAQRFVDVAGTCGGNTPCFTTIQAAVTAASSGETITVYPGTYTESVLIGGKNLTLISTAGRGATTIQGVENGIGTLVIDGSTTNFNLGTTASNGFTIIGIANDNNNTSEVGAVVVKDGPHTNLKIVGNDIRAKGDDGFLHYFGTTITGLKLDNNIFSGQTYSGTQPEQTCCSGTCYFNAAFTNVARSLVSINGSNGGPVVSGLQFTNNQITGSAGAGSNGNILVQITASNALVQQNTFSGTTVSMGATCNRGSLRVRGTGFTIDYNQFNSAGLSGPGAYHIQFDQGDSFAGGNAQVNTLAGVAGYNLYDVNPVAYYNPLGAGCTDFQRSVFVSSTAASTYAVCGGTLATVTGACATPLPVSLLSFTAKGVDNRVVQLDWATETEKNNNYFLLERSKDLDTFESVDRINAKEGQAGQGHTYTYTDQNPYSGTSYYRLRQVDLSGTITAYPSVSVVLRGDGYGVFPNPVTDQRFTLHLDEPQTAFVNLYSADGRSLPLQKVSSGAGTLQLKTVKQLPVGVYVLTVEERGQTRKHRLIVE